MDFLKIDIDNLELKSFKNYINIEIDNKPLKIKTPKLLVPFGLEEKFKNYYLNLELDNYKKDNYQNSFLLFLENLEKKMVEKLGIDKDLFNSQISYRKNDKIIIYTKIMEKFRKFTTKVVSNHNHINIFNLGKNIHVTCQIVIDKIWIIKGKYWYKIKLDEICVL